MLEYIEQTKQLLANLEKHRADWLKGLITHAEYVMFSRDVLNTMSTNALETGIN
jgi:hypothetical protein